MYSKAEKSNIKKEFWTAFGLYMKPVRNAEGATINWVNYKTGIRHIYFRMDADTKLCAVAIEIKHPVAEEQDALYEKFISVKKIFTSICGEDWNWNNQTYDEDGRLTAKINTEATGLNIMKKEDWPQIISFFKERMITLDEFWNTIKVRFE
ncbi:MAG: DUF4268 domain-containing protein [Niabella sp.]